MIAIPPHAFSSGECLLALGMIFFLYAETHYHFRFAPSLLYRRRPEIIADAPHRLEPGQALPILLIIKDAHRFPVRLQQVRAEIAQRPAALPSFPARAFGHQKPAWDFILQNRQEDIADPLWWRIYFVELPAALAGRMEVNIGVSYRCHGKSFFCWNDNHVGTSHAPLQVFRSLWPLPALPHYHHGDLHFHSDATSDQVEFGAPLQAVRALARAQGISFCAVTDHSYDLDDCPDDYLRNDPGLRKWHALQQRVRELNEEHRDFVIIPGEEVSCGNAEGDNVHFLVFNHPHFIAGSGDGGEKWLRTKPEHSVAEILALLDENALAFAAHPTAPVPFLQRKLLRRAPWHRRDFAPERLHGMQFWNGGARGEEEGMRWWRDFLLEGKRLIAIAGNDAHGNFNRFRQIALPCLTMAEHPRHVFGRFHTALKLHQQLGLEAVLAALRAGRATITNGVMLELEMLLQDGAIREQGDRIKRKIARLRVRALSTPEFGRLQRVVIWRGEIGKSEEEIFHECKNFAADYEFEALLDWPGLQARCYVRAEALCSADSSTISSHALTNPVWVNETAE